MAGPGFIKRQKELKRQEKQEGKAARKAERRRTTPDRPRAAGEEDPDIAGIVPGPQPVAVE